MFPYQADTMEKELEAMRQDIVKEKIKMDTALKLYHKANTYTVAAGVGDSVQGGKNFIYPFNGFTLIDQSLYLSLARYLAKMVDKSTEVLMTIETDGIGIATLVAAELGLPLVVCKSFHYNTPCLDFTQKTGYYSRTMYMPKIIEGKKVGIIDCLISTSSTIRAMIEKALSLPNTSITGVYCVDNKSNYQAAEESKTFFEGFPYRYLFDTKINEQGNVEARLSDHLKRVFWQEIDVKFYHIAEKFSELSNSSHHGYRVGSLIVDAANFEIAAWGYRRGKVHAEQDALSMLRNNYPNWGNTTFTIYTTLEPCTMRNDHGQTPCSHLLSKVPQIRWVVIGSIDNLEGKINGNGIKHLLAHGKNIRVFNTNQVFRAQEFADTNIRSLVSGSPVFCAV